MGDGCLMRIVVPLGRGDLDLNFSFLREYAAVHGSDLFRIPDLQFIALARHSRDLKRQLVPRRIPGFGNYPQAAAGAPERRQFVFKSQPKIVLHANDDSIGSTTEWETHRHVLILS